MRFNFCSILLDFTVYLQYHRDCSYEHVYMFKWPRIDWWEMTTSSSIGKKVETSFIKIQKNQEAKATAISQFTQ